MCSFEGSRTQRGSSSIRDPKCGRGFLRLLQELPDEGTSSIRGIQNVQF